MNQQLFKKNFCNQSSHYKNYGQFNGSHHVRTTKSTLFVVNKDIAREAPEDGGVTMTV